MSRSVRVLAVVVVGGLALVLWRVEARRSRTTSPGTASGGPAAPVGVDYRLSTLEAALHAPDGATPCETAYNALTALDVAARQTDQPRPWKTLADRPTFLGRCAALPQQEQLCLGPRYQAQNHGACDPIIDRYLGDRTLFEAP